MKTHRVQRVQRKRAKSLRQGVCLLSPCTQEQPVSVAPKLTTPAKQEVFRQGVVQFHVHQKDGILVCTEFFYGSCFLGAMCPRHHTPRPYHWQLRESQSKQWVSISHSAQQHLEALYCNHTIDTATLKESPEASASWELDLQTLLIKNSLIYDKARRLATTSDPVTSYSFHVDWVIYWQEKESWNTYQEPIDTYLNAAFEKGMWNQAFSLNGVIYNVDLKKFTQRNVKTGFTRSIRRRPRFFSDVRLSKNLQRVNNSIPGISFDSHPTFSRNPFLPAFRNYPPTWVPGLPEEGIFAKIPVPVSSITYRHIYKLFHKTVPETSACITAIHQIQNPWLWGKYENQRDFMAQRSAGEGSLVNEMHLFHGTTQSAVEAICRMNFDPRLSGSKNGHVYGQGTYFAREASSSARYNPEETTERYMFLAKVLVGKWVVGEASFRRPPPIKDSDPSGDLYDSCVNHNTEPTMFVIFDSCQCYPYFLIQYRNYTDSIIVS